MAEEVELPQPEEICSRLIEDDKILLTSAVLQAPQLEHLRVRYPASCAPYNH
jgi:hypothetical protein